MSRLFLYFDYIVNFENLSLAKIIKNCCKEGFGIGQLQYSNLLRAEIGLFHVLLKGQYNTGQETFTPPAPFFTPEPALLQARLSSEAQDCGGGAGWCPITAPGRPIQTPTQNTCASQIAGNTAQASYGKFRPVPRFW